MQDRAVEHEAIDYDKIRQRAHVVDCSLELWVFLTKIDIFFVVLSKEILNQPRPIEKIYAEKLHHDETAT